MICHNIHLSVYNQYITKPAMMCMMTLLVAPVPVKHLTLGLH